jgi:alpha-mannosidase
MANDRIDRRSFVRRGGLAAFSWALGAGLHWNPPALLLAAESASADDIPNWADPRRGASAGASSVDNSFPGGYAPINVCGEVPQLGWETETETRGAWIELDLGAERPVRELWVLSKPLPYDIVLDPYMRGGHMATPRRITYSFSGGASYQAELRQAKYLQILTLPRQETTRSIRLVVNEVWLEAGSQGTGLGKIKVFPQPHAASFQVSVYATYDARAGVAVQSATLEIVNPGEEIRGARLEVSGPAGDPAAIPLDPIPARSVSRQDVWIPAPFEDSVLSFRIAGGEFKTGSTLRVPAYHSYFDGGTFDLLCTNHNDLGWLDTQAVTADYRSAELILPALRLLEENPEFRYSMECVAYLIEFLERHPEKREEMAQMMRQGRFTWGASYVENLEVHVGPEKLVRQFYLGRKWLRNNFPGVDTRHYVKTDPPAMTFQMPQILAKAGVPYVLQGRFTWGFYRWEAPDGSSVFVFAFRYGDPRGLINPKGNQGWLGAAALRENYYAPRRLPPMMIYDFNSDYLPPAPALIPYARRQNEAMQRFAAVWNEHFSSQPERRVRPPQIRFVEPEAELDELTRHDLNIETVKGDWPINWAYYDEPSNREALLAGRQAHNLLLGAERLTAGLSLLAASPSPPRSEFFEAWRANCWPDHGWGGNRGTITDSVYTASYTKSRALAEKLFADAGAQLARRLARQPGELTLVVFNPVSWTRTDAVHCRLNLPSAWNSFELRDDQDRAVAYQVVARGADGRPQEIVFVAESVPSLGYRAFSLRQSSSAPRAETELTGDTMENELVRVRMGDGGVQSLLDKALGKEILRTDKFCAGEVLQFTAPGLAWEDPEIVTMDDFEKTSDYEFPIRQFVQGPVRSTLVRQAKFKHFLLRHTIHLYARLARLEFELEVLNWDGQKERELRVAFPINLERARLSYEVPFGTVEIGKDEVDFSSLPSSPDSQFRPDLYGGQKPLRFREAINWFDASSPEYGGFGCLAASNCTLHLFRDETSQAVDYPLLQHVLLSTRRSLAWNPDYWFTQAGDHRYRMALFPHAGGWRSSYREGFAFNYPLAAFLAEESADSSPQALPRAAAFVALEPSNLIATALKVCDDDGSLVLRFYEAEGFESRARIRFARRLRQAWRTNLIEEEPETLPVSAEGTLDFAVKPWEIVTLKVEW